MNLLILYLILNPPYISAYTINDATLSIPSAVNDVLEQLRKIKASQPKFLSNVPKVCATKDFLGIKDFRRILFKLTQCSYSIQVLSVELDIKTCYHRIKRVHNAMQCNASSLHYVVKTRICPIGITRFSVFCAILLASLGVRARLRVLSNTLNDVSQL
eukprot:sb/3473024/